MIEVRPPAPQFFDTDGSPLDAGYIYIGTTGANPETNPQAIFWDKDGTIPAAQPIRTLNGYPSRDGAVSKFYTSTKNYSISVKDKRGSLVGGVLNSDSGVFDELTALTSAAGIGYDPLSAGMASNNVQDAIEEVQTNVEAVAADVASLATTYSGIINLFANSAFIINTRAYSSGTNTGAPNQYTLDRLRVVVSGQSVIISVSTTFGFRITAPAGGLEQVIEGSMITGGDYACSWVGTGTVTVNGAARAKGETFNLDAAGNCTVRLVGEFEQFMFTRPNMVGQYEYDYVDDLLYCQRYTRLNSPGVGLSVSTTSVSGIAVSWSPPMRITPTASLFNGTSALLEPGVAARDATSVAAFNGNESGGYLDINGTSIVSGKLHTLIHNKVLFTAEF
jgi:hypothetical protein